MAEAAAIGVVASVASLALTASSDVTKGNAQQASNEFQADRAQRAAEFGKTQALLTDTTMRENLNTTLGNIEAVRAAAGIDPRSPTTAAIMERNEGLSDRQRMAAAGSQRAQSAEDLASADYLRRAGDFAVTQSYLTAATDVGSGIAKGYGRGGAFASG